MFMFITRHEPYNLDVYDKTPWGFFIIVVICMTISVCHNTKVNQLEQYQCFPEEITSD